MPVVVIASPKGGSAKTTTNLVVGLQLVERGLSVCYIDADAEEHITDWAKMDGKPDLVTVVNDVTEETIIDVISEQSEKADFVFVDLEGTASLMVAHAVGMADFVVVPCQGGRMDGQCAAKAIKMIKNQQRLIRRDIPFAVLFTRTHPSIETKALKNIKAEFNKANVPVFENSLQERAVYRDLFDFGGTLQKLHEKSVSNLPKAISNAEAVASELIGFITKK